MELFHVMNRGVDKRTIYMDDRDYARFVHDLWEFNDAKPTPHAHHSFSQNLGLRNPDIKPSVRPKGDRIVDIHGWCLMKNHYHLLLSERSDGGLVLFLRKLNVGYANYFNERHEREGSLFQGRTKKIPIESDAHFLHILNYIHFNPLDFLRSAEDWRSGTIQNATAAQRYLVRYAWSSYNDYCGRKKFPSILTTELFGEKAGVFEKKSLTYLREMQFDVLADYKLE